MKLLTLKIFTFLLGLTLFTVNSEETAENVICKKCNCDKENKIIGCSNIGLKKMFSYKEWEALNATDVLYETLKLDHNLLESIDITFPLLKSPLKRIDFSHNKIKQVAVRTFYNLSFIEEIDFSYNQLKFEKFKKSSIFEGKYKATEWEQLEDLKKLDLSHNLLNNLDMSFFEHIEGLKELKLNDNPFQIIHDSCVLAMTGLHNLTRLDMSRMELESIPDNFFLPLDKLEWLDLSGNLLKTIPNGLRTLDNIQDLSLSDNPIKDLNKTEHNFLPPLTTLKRLNLTYMMEMKSIGKETLKGLENLEELHISNNHHLSHIDVDAFKFPEKDNENRSQWPIITKLFLNNNNLSYLDMLTFNNWNKLEEVHIHDNPWECVCELEWVLEYLIPIVNKTTPHLIDHIKCNEPGPMSGQLLTELSEEHYQLRCNDMYGAHPENDSALLVALLIGVLLGIPLTFATMMIYKRGCRRHQTSDYSRAFYSRANSGNDFA